MSPEKLNAIAAAMSAIAALAALAIGWMSIRQSRQVAEATRRQTAHLLDAALQSRLDPLYPGLRRVLGHLEDGVPLEIREVLIPFFVLYSDSFAAHRDGLLNARDWRGVERELAYWAQKPVARRAWAAFSQQTWTDGFCDYMEEMLAGEAAYPTFKDNNGIPEVLWPDAPAQTPGQSPP